MFLLNNVLITPRGYIHAADTLVTPTLAEDQFTETLQSSRAAAPHLTFTRAVPYHFIKTSPADSSTVSGTSLLLQWNEAVGADSYEYCVATTTTDDCTNLTTLTLDMGDSRWSYFARYVGRDNSLALTSDNTPVISYYDANNGDLKLVVCSTTDCSDNFIPRTIDYHENVGQYTSLALTSDNKPVISYHDNTHGQLKIIACSTTDCSDNPTSRTLDTGDVGMYTSLALTSDNTPVISYYDYMNDDLKLVVCGTTDCSDNPIPKTLDDTWLHDVGRYNSLALTSDNKPIISYYDNTNADLKLIVCSTTDCSDNPTPRTLSRSGSGHVGKYNSLALTSDNKPVISYLNENSNDLELIVCSTTDCSGTNMLVPIDTVAQVGQYTSLALTSDNKPVISYHDFTNKYLKLAICSTTDCTGDITLMTPDTTNWTGMYTSLALTSDNKPVISYYYHSFGHLKLAFSSWKSVGANTAVSITDLAHNTTYYWQVRATNAYGTTQADNGSFAQFVVWEPTPTATNTYTPTATRFATRTATRTALPIPKPKAFNKVAPANTLINRPLTLTLSWAASSGATSYEYCLATTATKCTNWKSVGTARSITVRNLARNKAYFWNVRARNAAGITVSNNGGVFKFTTRP